MDPTLQTYRIYGQRLASDFRFLNRLTADPPASGTLPDLTFRGVDEPPVRIDPRGAKTLFTSPVRTPEGESHCRLLRFQGLEVMRFPNAVDYFLRPDRIEGYTRGEDNQHQVEIYFLGSVFAYWLERLGIPALHASAVTVRGHGAIAFLAGKTAGKTALAAALMQLGHPLLTDDILPVEERSGTFFGMSSYPQMRMWPEQAAHFVGDPDEMPRVHPAFSKRRIAVGQGGFGESRPQPGPLRCIYLPERRDMTAQCGKVEIETVSPANAVIELVRRSFSPYIVEAVGLQPRRLAFFARLVQEVPVRRLIYPNGFEHLPRVVGDILRNLESDGRDHDEPFEQLSPKLPR